MNLTKIKRNFSKRKNLQIKKSGRFDRLKKKMNLNI